MCVKYFKVLLYTVPKKHRQEPHGKGKIYVFVGLVHDIHSHLYRRS